MKSKFSLLVAIFATALTSVADVELPLLQDGGTTAGVWEGEMEVPKSAPSPVTIRIFPSFGPPQAAASFAGYAGNASGILNNTGNLPTGARQGPSDARLIDGLITVDDFMNSTTVAFYRRNFSPAPPWQDERGGTVWWWMEIMSSTNETTALYDVDVVNSSSPQNFLGLTKNFRNAAYTPTAFGVLADGVTKITSGPSTQRVKKIILAVGSRSFPVNNQANVDEVVSYWNQFQDLSTTCTVTVGGSTASKTLYAYNQPVPVIRVPSLQIFAGNTVGTYTLRASTNSSPGAVYMLQKATNLHGSYADLSNISPGQPLTVVSGDPNAFFRIRHVP